MEEYYNKSRIVMLVLAVVISLIMFINEDISFKIYGTFFIAIITLVVSFLVTPISKKMIEIGDKLEKKLWRILYYFFHFIFIAICAIFDSIIFEKPREKKKKLKYFILRRSVRGCL